MKNHSVLIVDLALTQAIEQYIEMLPHEAYNAILRDWPEQIASLLFEFMFRAGGPTGYSTTNFKTTSLRDDNTAYITSYEEDER